MVFKRVFHPVGQGAFFTEQFYNEKGDAVFNVLYDCGEKRSTKHLDIEIDNTLNLKDKPLVINVLFISHLDEDHINGLSRLVKMGCLTKKSVVILPLHYPLVLKLILQQLRNSDAGLYVDGTYEGLMSLFDSEAKILGISNNGDVLDNSLILDEGLTEVKNYSAVKSMQPLRYKDLWYYLPFNTILDDDRYQKFQDALGKAGIDKGQLSDSQYVLDHITELTAIYKHLPKGVGKVTSINVNSLNVLSYGAKDLNYSHVWLNYIGNGIGFWWHPWDDLEYMAYKSRCSCLYTGDCVMEKHFDTCISSLIKHIIPVIGILQIPHHGRETCYNKAIACRKEIISGFTNFNSTHKANCFVKQILHDFSVSYRLFFQITEDYLSRMELYVHL